MRKRLKKRITAARKRPAVDSGGRLEKLRALRLFSYEVTTEPLEDPNIPEEVKKEMYDLYVKTQKAPESAVERLRELIDEYPNVPVLYNYIALAYSRINEPEKAREYAVKNYRENPDYLFANRKTTIFQRPDGGCGGSIMKQLSISSPLHPAHVQDGLESFVKSRESFFLNPCTRASSSAFRTTCSSCFSFRGFSQ